MLDVSPTHLLEEIEASEKLRDDHLASLESQVDRYHGPSWRGSYNYKTYDYDPHNHAFQYIAAVIPQIACFNPRFLSSSRRGAPQKQVAEAIRHGMNRWAVDTNVQETAERAAVDQEFAYGVLMTTQQPVPWTDAGESEVRMRPQMRRISPKEHGIDPLAKDVRECRFQWSLWTMDKDDLLTRAREHPEEGWHAEAIEKIAADTGIEKLHRDREGQSNPSRDELVGYSIWVPEYELPFGEAEKKKYKAKSWKEAGFNGSVVTISIGQPTDPSDEKAYKIRDDQPYYGPRWGPYQIVGTYYVPDSAIPLGTLTAVESQNQEVNTHKRAYLRSAARRKKIGMVGGGDSLLANLVKNAEDGDVVTANVAEIGKNYLEAELGGCTPEQRLAIIDLMADLYNASGMSDARMGNVTGVGTATENQIANQASSTRVGWHRIKFYQQFGLACRTVAYYLYHDDRVKFPLGDGVAQEMGAPGEEVWFEGGTHGEGSGATFDDLELTIQPFSMSYVDEGVMQQRAMAGQQLVQTFLPMIVQFPSAGLDKFMFQLAEQFGITDLDQQINIQGLIADGQAMMQQGQGMQPQGQPSQPAPQLTPRLAGDIGMPRKITPPGMAQSKNPQPAQAMQNGKVKKVEMAGTGVK